MENIFIYIRGICFVGIFIALVTSLGNKLLKEKSFPLSFIVGYVFYTCIQACIGVFIQLFHLDRIYYYIAVTLLWCIYLGMQYKKFAKMKNILQSIKQHFVNYGVFYVVAITFTFLAITNIEGLWTGNRLDDGAYLSQIGQSLTLRDMYDINTATGYATPYDFIRLVNTFEIEASLYSTIFQIPTTVYLKCFLPFLNYFLFVSCVYYLSYFLTSKNHRASLCLSSCTLLFGLTSAMLQTNHILVLTDDWQFNWAMGYGSSIVRVMGYMLVFVPFLKEKVKITYKELIYFIVVSIALVSKATQALPVLYIAVLIYFVVWVHQRFEMKTQYVIYAIVCFLLCVVPTNVDSFSIRFDLVYLIVQDNFASHYKYIFGTVTLFICLLRFKSLRDKRCWITLLFLLGSIYVHNILYTSLLLFIFSFTSKSEVVKRWNFILLLIGCLMFIPKLNTMFIVLSIYSFVASRAITLFAITFICTCFVYLYFLIKHFQRKDVVSCILVSSVGVCSFLFYMISYNESYGLINAFRVVKQNPYLIPQSTLDLQDHLQHIAETSGQQIDVVMPVMHYVDSNIHFPYVLLRVQAKDVNSVSAVLRYPNMLESNPLSKYSQSDQDVLEKINVLQSDDQDLLERFNDILLKYPEIDVVVVQNGFAVEVLEQATDLRLVDTVKIRNPQGNHYILKR